MRVGEVTLFIERLPAWVAAAPEVRAPALERLIARGRALPPPAPRADSVRMALLGADPRPGVPVGALTAAAGAGRRVEGYWLRADPVSLRASLTQVYLAAAGMADMDPEESRQIVGAVRAELGYHGLELMAQEPAGWALRLPGPLPFEFAALDEALGADVAEHLPATPAARDWRRLMNDLQIALHNHPVNERRRLSGRPIVNGVWFWGGGEAPARPPGLAGARVHASHPVSAGLAACFDLPAAPPPADPAAIALDAPAYVDWPSTGLGAGEELERLDAWIAALPGRIGIVRLYAGTVGGWASTGRRSGRWWKRRRPLVRTFAAGQGG